MDEITNLNQEALKVAAANDGMNYHERRMQTFYLVGMEDLEPILSDLINKAYQMAQ